jgi:hypothetical protein
VPATCQLRAWHPAPPTGRPGLPSPGPATRGRGARPGQRDGHPGLDPRSTFFAAWGLCVRPLAEPVRALSLEDLVRTKAQRHEGAVAAKPLQPFLRSGNRRRCAPPRAAAWVPWGGAPNPMRPPHPHRRWLASSGGAARSGSARSSRARPGSAPPLRGEGTLVPATWNAGTSYVPATCQLRASYVPATCLAPGDPATCQLRASYVPATCQLRAWHQLAPAASR